MAYTLLEKKTILHELEEKVAKSEMNDNPNVRAGLSEKNKTELRDVCKALSIPLSGHETKPQLTRKIKEVQARTRTTTTGNPGPDDSEVPCNLKTMNEQQRALLRKSGKTTLHGRG